MLRDLSVVLLAEALLSTIAKAQENTAEGSAVYSYLA